jgi:hypothetical protein
MCIFLRGVAHEPHEPISSCWPVCFERGGLTSVNELDATTAVARFDFCEDCDIEVPVDVAVNPTAK